MEKIDEKRGIRMDSIIETKDIVQSFPIAGGEELVILKHIDIRIPAKQLTMLRGRSGPEKQR